jgi:hypothetical protein
MAQNETIITDYREAKKKAEQLAVAARKQMQGKYLALLTEAADILRDFKDSFRETPTLPTGVKAFTLGEGKKNASADAPDGGIGHKIGGLRRSLAAAMKKGDKARQEVLIRQLASLGADMSIHADLEIPPAVPAPVEQEIPAF